MGNFLQLALLAAQAVVAEKSAPPRGLNWCRVIGMVSVVLCILIASGFLLTALWLFLVPIIGAIDTALVIAALALFKATWIALVLRYWRASPKVAAPAAQLPALPWAELEAAFNSHKAPTLLAALLAGVIAGSSGNKQP